MSTVRAIETTNQDLTESSSSSSSSVASSSSKNNKRKNPSSQETDPKQTRPKLTMTLPSKGRFTQTHSNTIAALGVNQDIVALFRLYDGGKGSKIEEMFTKDVTDRIEILREKGLTAAALIIVDTGQKIKISTLQSCIFTLQRKTAATKEKPPIAITSLALVGPISNITFCLENFVTPSLERLVISQVDRPTFFDELKKILIKKQIDPKSFQLLYASSPLRCRFSCECCRTKKDCEVYKSKLNDYKRWLTKMEPLKKDGFKCLPYTIKDDEVSLQEMAEIARLPTHAAATATAAAIDYSIREADDTQETSSIASYQEEKESPQISEFPISIEYDFSAQEIFSSAQQNILTSPVSVSVACEENISVNEQTELNTVLQSQTMQIKKLEDGRQIQEYIMATQANTIEIQADAIEKLRKEIAELKQQAAADLSKKIADRKNVIKLLTESQTLMQANINQRQEEIDVLVQPNNASSLAGNATPSNNANYEEPINTNNALQLMPTPYFGAPPPSPILSHGVFSYSADAPHDTSEIPYLRI